MCVCVCVCVCVFVCTYIVSKIKFVYENVFELWVFNFWRSVAHKSGACVDSATLKLLVYAP